MWEVLFCRCLAMEMYPIYLIFFFLSIVFLFYMRVSLSWELLYSFSHTLGIFLNAFPFFLSFPTICLPTVYPANNFKHHRKKEKQTRNCLTLLPPHVQPAEVRNHLFPICLFLKPTCTHELLISFLLAISGALFLLLFSLCAVSSIQHFLFNCLHQHASIFLYH